MLGQFDQKTRDRGNEVYGLNVNLESILTHYLSIVNAKFTVYALLFDKLARVHFIRESNILN